MNIYCYIPLAIGQIIPQEVCNSLASQSIEINAIPCYMPGVVQSQSGLCKDARGKVIGERLSRNLALDFMKKSNDEFAIMQDRDIIHLYPDNYEKAIIHLKKNPDVAVISLPWKNQSCFEHIRIQALIFRISLIGDFSFIDDGLNHTCMTVMNYFKEKYQWFPSDHKLIKELL